MPIKFTDSRAAAYIVSQGGLFRKMPLIASFTDAENEAMYQEDVANGFPAAIALKTREVRARRDYLTVLNGVARYGAADSHGHPFAVEQGVSAVRGGELTTKMAAFVTFLSQPCMPTPMGSPSTPYAGPLSDIKGVISARAAAIRAEVRSVFGVDCEVIIATRAGNRVAATGEPPLYATALSSAPSGTRFWRLDDFEPGLGKYVIHARTNDSAYWQSSDYAANKYASYIWLDGITWMVRFISPYLWPLLSSAPKKNASAASGEASGEHPCGAGSSFAYTNWYVTGPWTAIVGLTYSSGTRTSVNYTMTDLNGYLERGMLLGAPTPVDEFLLRRCSVERNLGGPAKITTADDSLYLTVSGPVLSTVLEADPAIAAEMSGKRYGLWITNRARQMPADPYQLIPHWNKGGAADKLELKNTVVVDHEGVAITVDKAVSKAASQRVTAMAFLLGELLEDTSTEDVMVSVDGTPTFSSTEAEWLAAYLQSGGKYTFNAAEGAPYQTAKELVEGHFGVFDQPGSVKVRPASDVESRVFFGGGLDPALHDGAVFFQCLISCYAVSRKDLTDALKAFWANGAVVHQRYVVT